MISSVSVSDQARRQDMNFYERNKGATLKFRNHTRSVSEDLLRIKVKGDVCENEPF